MRLGIAVVYLVGQDDGRLLDTHLAQIRRHTQVPYTIYASANRLRPEFRLRLEQHPEVRICDCPTTDLRGSLEHAHYLEHLVKFAVEDGASHIATLHVDSFPIRSGWAQELAARLSDTCVVATLGEQLTACLLFQRDFYLKHRPTFRLSEAEESSPTYRRFYEEYRLGTDSGYGYAYRAFAEGLSWYSLRETTKAKKSIHGRVHDGMIFHLGSGNRMGNVPFGEVGLVDRSRHATLRALWRMQGTLQPITPRSVRLFVQRLLLTPRLEREMFHETRGRLLGDPDSFLYGSRAGSSPTSSSRESGSR